MPVDFLTTEQVESYGRFTGEPDELQLARYFHLDEADKEFIGKSRGDHNRLGIALQIGCVRFLGTFLTDMNHIPSGVRHFTARQLGIRDITVLAGVSLEIGIFCTLSALFNQSWFVRG